MDKDKGIYIEKWLIKVWIKKFVEDYYKSGGTGSIKEDHPKGYYDKNSKPVIPYMRIIIKNKTMNIELKEITVRELTNSYKDNNDDGVVGYGGKLDIRPPLTWICLWDVKERNAVINTLQRIFHWMSCIGRYDASYKPSAQELEVIDFRQQRNLLYLPICEWRLFYWGRFIIYRKTSKYKFLEYKLMVYFVRDSEKLDWFEKPSTLQEKYWQNKNYSAVYSGFVGVGCETVFFQNSRPKIGDEYLNGSAIAKNI